MPDEATQKWLQLLFEEAARRGFAGDKIISMVMKGAFSTAEPDNRGVEALNTQMRVPDAKLEVMDWVRVGELLRHELEWDNAYPARPPS
jgi:hypothetical protein